MADFALLFLAMAAVLPGCPEVDVLADPTGDGATLPAVPRPRSADAAEEAANEAMLIAFQLIPTGHTGILPEGEGHPGVRHLLRAASYLRWALEERPDDPPLHRQYTLLLGWVGMVTGNIAWQRRLLDEYRNWYEDERDRPDRIARYASVLLAGGETDTARELLQTALEDFPADVDLNHTRGLLALEDGDVAGAIAYLQTAADGAMATNAASSLEILPLLAQLYSTTGALFDAIEAQEALLARHPDPGIDAYMLLAEWFVQADDLEDALDVLVVRLPPSYAASARHLALLGDIYQARENFLQARLYYMIYLAQYPQDAAVWERVMALDEGPLQDAVPFGSKGGQVVPVSGGDTHGE